MAIFLLSLLSYSVSAELGCCGTPAVPENICLDGDNTKLVQKDTCCPADDTNPDFYDSTDPALPDNQADCWTRFFSGGTEANQCDGVPVCGGGCCCDGTTGTPSTQALCSGTFYSQSCDVTTCTTTTPTCDDGIQNQGEEGVDCGGPCPACSTQQGQCTDPGYAPVLDGLSFTHTRGELQIGLSWNDPCSADIKTYNIYRCPDAKNICEAVPLPQWENLGEAGAPSFVDNSDSLLFDTTYTYAVEAVYNTPRPTNPTVMGEVFSGNIECSGKTTSPAFCVQPITYYPFEDYLTTNRPDKFSTASFPDDVKNFFAGTLHQTLPVLTGLMSASSGTADSRRASPSRIAASSKAASSASSQQRIPARRGTIASTTGRRQLRTPASPATRPCPATTTRRKHHAKARRREITATSETASGMSSRPPTT